MKQKMLQADMRNKVSHEKATVCGSSLKVFIKSTCITEDSSVKSKEFEQIADTSKR